MEYVRNGGLVTKSVTGGNYYLWINVKDKAGNKADKIITNAYKVVYTIEYDANGGENAPESQEKLNDVDTKISSSIPNKSGYTFKGWAEFNSATTAKYQPGDTYSDNESVKLYAIWEANTYKINYNLMVVHLIQHKIQHIFIIQKKNYQLQKI